MQRVDPGKRPLRRPKLERDDNIKTDLKNKGVNVRTQLKGLSIRSSDGLL
jgi:hypothetical protein